MNPYYEDGSVTLWHGDSLEVLRALPDQSVNCCVTSPPYYGLRDYGNDGQYGLEPTPAAYVETMRAVFAEVRRVLADDGTLWLNIGDSYSTRPRGSDNGWDKSRLNNPGRVQRMQDAALRKGRIFDLPEKNMLGIPWRTAFALQDDGWILRNAIVWNKPNAMPESVTDRLSTRHELIFMFTRSRRYWFELDPIREPILWPGKTGHTFGGNNPDVGRRRGAKYLPGNRGTYRAADGEQHLPGHEQGRNPGDVWTIPTQPFTEAHFAVFPVEIPRRAIQAGCKPGGVVLDPFSGSGTSGLAAGQLGRRYVGVDLSADYLDLSLRTRLAQTALVTEEPA